MGSQIVIQTNESAHICDSFLEYGIFSNLNIFPPQRAVLDFRLSEPSWYTVGIVLMLGTMAVYLATRKT